MSRENAEVVHQLAAAFNAGDADAATSLFDPACEVVFRPEVPEPGPFHGRAEVRQWVEGFLSAWNPLRVELVEVEDHGDRVFASVRQIGRGTGSGIDTEVTWPHVFTIRDGQITRWQGFADADEAREAARMSESNSH